MADAGFGGKLGAGVCFIAEQTGEARTRTILAYFQFGMGEVSRTRHVNKKMLSKKKSRPIEVEGTKFRWAISPDSGYVVFVAEREDVKGRKIEVYIDSEINRLWVEFPDIDDLNLKVIKPKDAASIILQAMQLGWDPEEKGAPIVFDCDNKGEIFPGKR